MQLSIFFLALLRILTYGNSRVLPALFRFARDSGSLLAFLPSLSPLPTYFFNKSGGLKWTRTIDLTLIRRVL